MRLPARAARHRDSITLARTDIARIEVDELDQRGTRIVSLLMPDGTHRRFGIQKLGAREGELSDYSRGMAVFNEEQFAHYGMHLRLTSPLEFLTSLAARRGGQIPDDELCTEMAADEKYMSKVRYLLNSVFSSLLSPRDHFNILESAAVLPEPLRAKFREYAQSATKASLTGPMVFLVTGLLLVGLAYLVQRWSGSAGPITALLGIVGILFLLGVLANIPTLVREKRKYRAVLRNLNPT